MIQSEKSMPDEKEEKITIREANLQSCREFYRQLVQDADLFADAAEFRPFVYDRRKADAKFLHDRNQPDRKIFYIFLGNRVIGEVGLKHIDTAEKSCELTICMANDIYKNRGYGTEAEKLMLRYAFDNMDMQTVSASVLIKNTRSRHVLEKLGFANVGSDGLFQYYKYSKP